jgi:hypothetical protein
MLPGIRSQGGTDMSRSSLPSTILFGASACLAAGIVTAAAADHAYVGAGKCKFCHNAAATGAQFDHWAKSAHAKAFATLATPEAKKTAAAKGVADPQKAPECLKCHVTGHGAPPALLKEKYDAKEGVSCESCHGPGGDYWQLNVMKDRAKSIAAGMLVPDEKTCAKCHNPESPQYKPFDYKTALAKIAHPNPKKAKK